MEWIIQAIKEEFIIRLFFGGFGNKEKTESNSNSIIVSAFIILIVAPLILCFHILKVFYYDIPKYLIKKYKGLTEKKKALVRILLLPLFVLSSLTASFELFSESDYISFLIGLVVTSSLIYWNIKSIKKYKSLMSLDDKERIHMHYHNAKAILKLMLNNIYSWGNIIYNSTFRIYSNTIKFNQSQKAIIDLIYYTLI